MQGHSSLYWIGGKLPKVFRFGTTLLSLHNPESLPAMGIRDGPIYILKTVMILIPSVFQLGMTHAHLRTSLYDEVINEIDAVGGGWIFARQGDGYGTDNFHRRIANVSCTFSRTLYGERGEL